MKKLSSCLLIFAISALSASVVRAEIFPQRPVTLIVPYPPGGSADILARTMGQRLAARLGQSVVIENKAGAGTAIGARYVAEAKPDGYTLLMGTVSSQAINPSMNNVGYDPLKDFVAIAPIASIPFVLVTHHSSPYRSVADVVTAARNAPGTLSYASAGAGTSNHLAGEMLATASQIKLLHVPYRGSAPALADVLAGHVPLMFDLQSTAAPNVQSQKLRALAVTGAARSALLPSVPTVAESGLPGFEVSAWFGIFAPAKVPTAVLARLSAEIGEIVKSADFTQRLIEMGAAPDTRGAAVFGRYVAEEVQKYGQVVRTAGLVR